MSCTRRSSSRRVVGAALIIGVLAGVSAGCSGNDPANLDLKAAKAALAKRKGDYGEVARKPADSRRKEH